MEKFNWSRSLLISISKYNDMHSDDKDKGLKGRNEDYATLVDS